MEIIKSDQGQILDIELEESLLAKNKELADANRRLLDEKKVTCIDIMGSIGSGKTSLIQNLTKILKEKYNIGVIAGDLTTEIDASRIEKEGALVVQVHTGKECHLDANLVKNALAKLPLAEIDILFIENVGNLICPAEFPLGAHKRIVVISVTEGPYMVVKHPFIFREADCVVINKIDLSQNMRVEPDKLKADITKVNKKALVFKTNCITGEGIGEIIRCMNFQ
jgi:hydrogenase nickel incorporation protein HypB